MNKKQIISLIIIVVVVAVVAVVLGTQKSEQAASPIVENGNNIDTNVPDSEPVENGEDTSNLELEPVIVTSNIDTSDWFLYENTRFGYLLRLPPGYKAINVHQGREIEFDPKALSVVAEKEDDKSFTSINIEGRFFVDSSSNKLFDRFEWSKRGRKTRTYVVNNNVFSEHLISDHTKYFYFGNSENVVKLEFFRIDDLVINAILASFSFTE